MYPTRFFFFFLLEPRSRIVFLSSVRCGALVALMNELHCCTVRISNSIVLHCIAIFNRPTNRPTRAPYTGNIIIFVFVTTTDKRGT